MATKKKEDWINGICELDNNNPGLLGDIPREDLEQYSVGQLKALYKDMEDELAAHLPATTDGTPEEPVDGETKEEFHTMCGSEFNPKTSGECFKQCQEDFPEAFAACIEHYKITDIKPVKAKSTKKAGIGKTEWQHLRNSQAGLIDDFFFNGGVGTLKEVSEFASGKETRCLHHMRHLVADIGVELLYAFRKVETEKGLEQEKIYWWAESDKRRTGEKLPGKSVHK